MNRASIYIFRDELASYLEQVVKTDTPLVIEKRGKPLVMVTPYKKEKEIDFEKLYGFLGEGEDGETSLKRVRRSKKERDRIKSLQR
jgi:prevent-host-death family protein